MDGAEISRRIEALRTLRGLTQVQLDVLGHELGLRKQELSRTERGELPMNSVRRHVLSRVLDVPEDWLREEDVDRLVHAIEDVRTLEQTLEASERRRQEDLAAVASELARQVEAALATGILPSASQSAATERKAADG